MSLLRTANGIAFRANVDLLSNNPIFLYCHATGFCKESWSAIINEVAARTSGKPPEWISLDFTGHGDSKGFANDSEIEWDRFGVNDVEDVLSAHNLLTSRRKIVGVGHSMGGAIATMAALKHKSLFSHLVLFEPILLLPEMSSKNFLKKTGFDMPFAALAKKRKNEFENWDAARAYFTTRGAFARFRSDALEEFISGALRERGDGKVVLKCDRDVEAKTYYGNDGACACRPRLREGVHAKVTVVAGAETAALGADETTRILPDFEEISRLFRDAKYLTVPNSGHFLTLEDPSACAQVIVDSVAEPRSKL